MNMKPVHLSIVAVAIGAWLLANAPHAMADAKSAGTTAQAKADAATKAMAEVDGVVAPSKTDVDAFAAARDADKAQAAADKAARQAAAAAKSAHDHPENKTAKDNAAKAAQAAKDAKDKAKKKEDDLKEKEKAADDEAAKGTDDQKKIHKKDKEVRRLQRDAAQAVRDFEKEVEKMNDSTQKEKYIETLNILKSQLNLMAFAPPPAGATMIADAVGSGRLTASIEGTGKTIGNVLTLNLANLTDHAMIVSIPAMVIVSISGLRQPYSTPDGVSVSIGPRGSANVPLNGVCLDARTPPATAADAGDLVAVNAAGQVVVGGDAFPALAAHALLAGAQAQQTIEDCVQRATTASGGSMPTAQSVEQTTTTANRATAAMQQLVRSAIAGANAARIETESRAAITSAQQINATVDTMTAQLLDVAAGVRSQPQVGGALASARPSTPFIDWLNGGSKPPPQKAPDPPANSAYWQEVEEAKRAADKIDREWTDVDRRWARAFREVERCMTTYGVVSPEVTKAREQRDALGKEWERLRDLYHAARKKYLEVLNRPPDTTPPKPSNLPLQSTSFRGLIGGTKTICISTETLQSAGKLDTPFASDPAKNIATVQQWAVWLWTSILDNKPITKADLTKKICDQATKAAGSQLTPELQRQLQPGIDQLWNQIQKVTTGVLWANISPYLKRGSAEPTVTPYPSGFLVKNPDGTVVDNRNDGTQIIIRRDGTRIERSPDGSISITPPPAPAGDTRSNITGIEQFLGGVAAGGFTIVTLRDGTQVVNHSDGSVTSVHPDGSYDGRDSDGSTWHKAPDGTYTRTNPDGSQVEIRRDGTQINRPPGTVNR